MMIRADMNAPGVWDLLAPYLVRALEASGADKQWGIEDVRVAAEKQEIDIWSLMDHGLLYGAGATALYVYPRCKVVDVLLLGTEPNHEAGWASCFEQLKELARSVGASKITGTGRPGWARALGATERCVFDIEV